MSDARDRLEAYMIHESDEDAAEYARRLDAYRAEVLREAADWILEHPLPGDAPAEFYAELVKALAEGDGTR